MITEEQLKAAQLDFQKKSRLVSEARKAFDTATIAYGEAKHDYIESQATFRALLDKFEMQADVDASQKSRVIKELRSIALKELEATGERVKAEREQRMCRAA